MRRFVVVAVALLLVGGTASAQSAEDIPRTEYRFLDELVESTLLRPVMDQEFLRRRVVTTSLIKIRENFIPEMFKSTESL